MLEPGVTKVRLAVDYRRETALLLDELATLTERKDHSVSRLIRSFLAQYRTATRDGNPASIRVGSLPVKRNQVVVFAHVTGAGTVDWLPRLVLPSSDRLTAIMRTVGRIPWLTDAPQRKPAPEDGDKPPRRGFPPPPKTELVRPKLRLVT